MSEHLIIFDHGNASVGDVTIVGLSATGQQGLSQLYEYDVFISVQGDGGLSDDAIDSLLSTPVRIGFGEGGVDEVHGVIKELEMLSTHSLDRTDYRLQIVPKLWYLTLTRRNRVFQDATYLDIIKTVLEEHGLQEGTHVADDCSLSYEEVEYTVQHEESDFSFIHRLMEHYGIHYHFQPNPDGEMMVLGDGNDAFEPVADHESFHYSATHAANDHLATITSLRRVRRVLPETIQVRDYNWRTPTTPVKGPADVDDTIGHGMVDIFGEHVSDNAEAGDVAQVRAEELLVSRDTFQMETGSRRLYPGALFSVSGHPNPDLDQSYIVTRMEHGLEHGGGGRYSCSIDAIPTSTVYRPLRLTAWPRIDGVINAKVDGESRSTMTPVDSDGRYKVVIPGDERGRGGGKASRWVRRSQPSAGSGYGMHLPLHVGTECVIAHVNGDPDRPVILGAVPNAETPSPVTGPNGTHSRILTGSGVLIELDDDC